MRLQVRNRKATKSARRLALIVAIVAGLLVVFASVSFAVHDNGLFELDVRAGVDGDQAKPGDPIPAFVGDGNTVDDPLVAGDDWENILADWKDGTPAGDNSGAFAISIAEDTFANNPINGLAEPWVPARTPENSFFTGGGSKDTNGIQDGPWLYGADDKNDVVPDKNDIVNAFAAAYDDPENGTIFYFGLDTYSVKGAANAGFWFFRQPVGLNPLVGELNVGTFSGEHTDGDIFVAVAYTQGGRVGTIDVYKWVGDDATGGLGPKLGSGGDCALASAGDEVCGVINKLLPNQIFGENPVFDYANILVSNNPDPIANPRSYQYQSAAFVEFGLDIEAVLGEDIGCFSSFLAETRSSQSVSAQLKDFAFGAFPVCGIDVTKGGDDLAKVADPLSYSITIENTGRATLYKESIIDSLAGDLTDGTNVAITSSDCGASLAPDATCTITYDYIVPPDALDPLENTIDIVYKEFDDFTGVAFADSAAWEVNLFQPAISMTKTGDDLSKIGDLVDYEIVLSNDSSVDTPDLTCSISDPTVGAGATDFVLASGETKTINVTDFEIPGDALDPFLNTATATCSPAGFGNVLEASASHSVDLFQPSITFDKTGDPLSKIGDDTDYKITLTNTSTSDTPPMTCLINDAKLGIVDDTVTLAWDDDPYVIDKTVAMPDTEADPYINTASVECTFVDFPNVLNDSDSHSVNLFQPAINLVKTGDTLSKIGDDTDYTITLTNSSSADTPDMSCTITDAKLGIVQGTTLVAGQAPFVIDKTVAMPDTPDDPYIKTASEECTYVDFPNVLN
jgi:hypothetical protein